MRALAYALWVLLIVLVLFPGWFVRKPPTRAAAPLDELVKDPQCETYVLRSRAVRREGQGGVLFFCSDDCARRYHRTA